MFSVYSGNDTKRMFAEFDDFASKSYIKYFTYTYVFNSYFRDISFNNNSGYSNIFFFYKIVNNFPEYKIGTITYSTEVRRVSMVT